jgi:hypothetical protein
VRPSSGLAMLVLGSSFSLMFDVFLANQVVEKLSRAHNGIKDDHTAKVPQLVCRELKVDGDCQRRSRYAATISY